MCAMDSGTQKRFKDIRTKASPFECLNESNGVTVYPPKSNSNENFDWYLIDSVNIIVTNQVTKINYINI